MATIAINTPATPKEAMSNFKAVPAAAPPRTVSEDQSSRGGTVERAVMWAS